MLGNSAAVVDLQSGELLEVSTFLPSGVRETYRTRSATGGSGFEAFSLEPNGFTGKEGDDEVGLMYFGHRYLMPHLGRWASPDPLEIHQPGEGGEFGNAFHYIGGNLLQATDPTGLGECDASGQCVGRDQEANEQPPTPDAVFVAFSGNTSPSAMAGNTVSPSEIGTTGVVHDEVVQNSTGTTNSRVYATDAIRRVVAQAANFIEANVDATGEHQTTRVVIYGYSMGGVAALELVRELESRGVAVDLMVTVDATQGLDYGDVDQDDFDRTVSDNVEETVNYYQTETSDMGPQGTVFPIGQVLPLIFNEVRIGYFMIA